MARFNAVPEKRADGKVVYRPITKEEKAAIAAGGASAARDVYGVGSGGTISGTQSGAQQTTNTQQSQSQAVQADREQQAQSRNLKALEDAKAQNLISQKSYEELKFNIQNSKQIEEAVEAARRQKAQNEVQRQAVIRQIQQNSPAPVASSIINTVRSLPPSYQNPETTRAVAQYAGDVAAAKAAEKDRFVNTYAAGLKGPGMQFSEEQKKRQEASNKLNEFVTGFKQKVSDIVPDSIEKPAVTAASFVVGQTSQAVGLLTYPLTEPIRATKTTEILRGFAERQYVESFIFRGDSKGSLTENPLYEIQKGIDEKKSSTKFNEGFGPNRVIEAQIIKEDTQGNNQEQPYKPSISNIFPFHSDDLLADIKKVSLKGSEFIYRGEKTALGLGAGALSHGTGFIDFIGQKPITGSALLAVPFISQGAGIALGAGSIGFSTYNAPPGEKAKVFSEQLVLLGLTIGAAKAIPKVKEFTFILDTGDVKVKTYGFNEPLLTTVESTPIVERMVNGEFVRVTKKMQEENPLPFSVPKRVEVIQGRPDGLEAFGDVKTIQRSSEEFTLKDILPEELVNYVKTTKLLVNLESQYYGRQASLLYKQIGYKTYEPLMDVFGGKGNGFFANEALKFGLARQSAARQRDLMGKSLTYNTFRLPAEGLDAASDIFANEALKFGLARQSAARQRDLMGKSLTYNTFRLPAEGLDAASDIFANEALKFGLARQSAARQRDLMGKSLTYNTFRLPAEGLDAASDIFANEALKFGLARQSAARQRDLMGKSLTYNTFRLPAEGLDAASDIFANEALKFGLARQSAARQRDLMGKSLTYNTFRLPAEGLDAASDIFANEALKFGLARQSAARQRDLMGKSLTYNTFRLPAEGLDAASDIFANEALKFGLARQSAARQRDLMGKSLTYNTFRLPAEGLDAASDIFANEALKFGLARQSAARQRDLLGRSIFYEYGPLSTKEVFTDLTIQERKGIPLELISDEQGLYQPESALEFQVFNRLLELDAPTRERVLEIFPEIAQRVYNKKGAPVKDFLINIEGIPENKRAIATELTEKMVAELQGTYFGSLSTKQLPMEGGIKIKGNIITKGFQNKKQGDIDVSVPGLTIQEIEPILAKYSELYQKEGLAIELSPEGKGTILQFKPKDGVQGEKFFEAKSGINQAEAGLDDIAPAGIAGYQFANLKSGQGFFEVVPFGKNTAITAGEQTLRKFAGALMVSPGKLPGETESFGKAGLLGKQGNPRGLKDTAGALQGTLGLAYLDRKSLNPFVRIKALETERLGERFFESYEIEQRADIQNKLIEIIGSPDAPLEVELTIGSRSRMDSLSRSFSELSSPSPFGSAYGFSPSSFGSPSPSPSPRPSPSPYGFSPSDFGSPSPSPSPSRSPSPFGSAYGFSPSDFGSPSPSPSPSRSPSPFGSAYGFSPSDFGSPSPSPSPRTSPSPYGFSPSNFGSPSPGPSPSPSPSPSPFSALEEPFSDAMIYGSEKKKQNQNQAYDVYVRRGDKRGDKFVKVADNLPRNKALNFGSQIVDNYIEASFRLVADGKTKKEDDYFQPDMSKFGMPKKGSKLPGDTFIEKKGSRLDSLGEVQQISWFKRKKGGFGSF